MSIELPTHDDISERRSKGDALTALELFIYDWEPVAAGEWRAQLAAALAEASGQWRPIETAPKDGTKFDAWTRLGERIADVWWERGHWVHWWLGGWSGMEVVRVTDTLTHWMPLPAAPVAP